MIYKYFVFTVLPRAGRVVSLSPPPPYSPPDRHLHPHAAITVGLPKDCLPSGQYLQF